MPWAIAMALITVPVLCTTMVSMKTRELDVGVVPSSVQKIVLPSVAHSILTWTLSVKGPGDAGSITGSLTCGCTVMSADVVTSLSPMSGAFDAYALTM